MNPEQTNETPPLEPRVEAGLSSSASAGYAAGLSDERIVALKLELNRLIWENAADNMPLKQADEIACDCLSMIVSGKPHNATEMSYSETATGSNGKET